MSISGDEVQELVAQCQKIVEDANAGRISSEDAADTLKKLGVSGSVLESYLVQLQGPRDHQDQRDRAPEQDDRSKTPDGLDDSQRDEFRRNRDAVLGNRGQNGGGDGQGIGTGVQGLGGLSGMANSRSEDASDFHASASFLQQLKAIQWFAGIDSGSISSSTLESLPHLKDMAMSSGDSHVDETLRVKRVYVKEQNLDALVDLFQARPLLEPLPRSVWKKVLKDEYVSFEKLHAAIDPDYDHRDNVKDFGAGYALVKKDQLIAKKAVVTESEWSRVFEAWKSGVVEAFPHRKDELTKFGSSISNLFRNFAHDPSIPIRTDHEVRERYHKSPFRLDDPLRIQSAVLALVHRTSSIGQTKRQRDASPSSRPSKRA
ncbi:hypothetical protein GGU11DRAFT_733283, partial [Lentinula aff. detonsa]